MEQVKHILDSASVQRLQGVLKSRYGTGLQVDFIADISSVDMASQAPSVVEGALCIPLFSGEQFLAKAMLPTTPLMSPEDHNTIADLVKMILEPLLSRWLENQGQASFEIESQPNPPTLKNVFSLFGKTSGTDFQSKVRSFLTSVIYLECRHPHRLPKVIAEIDSLSGRWACVAFDQIQHQMMTVADIKSLGAMTLVVNDLLNISPEKRELLRDYIQSNPGDDMPLLLISSSTSLRELVATEVVSSEFAKAVQKCVLEVDRLPQKTELFKETLELFLEPGAVL